MPASTDHARLLPGPANFLVTEIPLYPPCGDGEHLYVEIEKENLTTDLAMNTLAKALGVKARDIGYAGRKDRHAVTRQWFSIHFGKADALGRLAELTPEHARLTVITVTRHRNKLRLGHLAGNRFRLGITGVNQEVVDTGLARLYREGLHNGFGPQRFGIAGATVTFARRWASGDLQGAAEILVDPHGTWRWGQAVPDGWRTGLEGRAIGALRRGAGPEAALAQCGEPLRQLAASAAQAAIFNAILAAREAAGLVHRLRVGDCALTARGAPFQVSLEDLDSVNERAAPGRLDAFASGPLPGPDAPVPVPAVLAEEIAWSASTGIDWRWFERGGPLASPGVRRPLLVPFRERPRIAIEDGVMCLYLELPPGAYATEVLDQVGIAMPADRSGP